MLFILNVSKCKMLYDHPLFLAILNNRYVRVVTFVKLWGWSCKVWMTFAFYR